MIGRGDEEERRTYKRKKERKKWEKQFDMEAKIHEMKEIDELINKIQKGESNKRVNE